MTLQELKAAARAASKEAGATLLAIDSREVEKLIEVIETQREALKDIEEKKPEVDCYHDCDEPCNCIDDALSERARTALARAEEVLK